jgi:hypothetical protein
MVSNKQRSENAWIRFKSNVEKLDGTVIENEWKGNNKPHHVMCCNGHHNYPCPSSLSIGQGICFECSKYRESRRDEFYLIVNQMGGIVLETEWKGAYHPHKIQCKYGHIGSPRPQAIRQGQGICRICGQGSMDSQKRFYELIESLNAKVLEKSWMGIHTPHKIQCANGHISSVRPNNLMALGQGICKICAWINQDVFYVVESNVGNIKLGITSGDYRSRLGAHSRDNFNQILFLKTNLIPGLARTTEIGLLDELKQWGYIPYKGNEYFRSNAKEFILARLLDIKWEVK